MVLLGRWGIGLRDGGEIKLREVGMNGTPKSLSPKTCDRDYLII